MCFGNDLERSLAFGIDDDFEVSRIRDGRDDEVRIADEGVRLAASVENLDTLEDRLPPNFSCAKATGSTIASKCAFFTPSSWRETTWIDPVLRRASVHPCNTASRLSAIVILVRFVMTRTYTLM